MSRTYCLIAVVAVMLVLAVPVQAEYTARVLGMGNTALAVGNDSAAWFNNPAPRWSSSMTSRRCGPPTT